MKKQILILAFFVLAMMAGSLSSFGQLVNNPTAPSPLALSNTLCPSDALHPLAGKSYTYAVTNPNGVIKATDTYTWWATKDGNFINAANLTGNLTGMLNVAAGELISAGTGTDYGVATVATASMPITWSPEILALTKYHATALDAPKTSTFVAVLATGGPLTDAGCTNNLQVYEINPLPSFTLDITNVNKTTDATLGYGTDFEQCVDQVRSAVYTAGDVVMDYGTNVLIYEVIAANFVTSWKPTFQIKTGSLATGTKPQIADISWYNNLADAKTGTTPIEAVTSKVDGDAFAGGTALTTSATNTTTGVSLYVRVVIKNQKFESIVDQPFTLIVDGIDSTNQWDLDNSTAATACATAAADQTDESSQTILARPDIQSNPNPASTVGTPADFVPKN